MSIDPDLHRPARIFESQEDAVTGILTDKVKPATWC
jgi:dihydroxyacid dehydratase/phosphogluconate dehydratase